jgi:hypothetical protein
LTLDDQEIVSLINDYEKESKALKNEALKISWHMRGGISYDDAMALSTDERIIVNNIISDNMEVTKKTGMPFF